MAQTRAYHGSVATVLFLLLQLFRCFLLGLGLLGREYNDLNVLSDSETEQSRPVCMFLMSSIAANCRHLVVHQGHNMLCLPKPLTTSYGINSFSYLAATSWNSLPDHYRTISDFTSFRRLISTGNNNLLKRARTTNLSTS